MTLQSSGAISMAQINAEFGRGTNLNAYRGTTWHNDSGGTGTFSVGGISFSDFYGKRVTQALTISSNQTNADLRTLAINAGWNQSSGLVITINSGVYIVSNNLGIAGLNITGSFPNGVTLINYGVISGMGGAGGSGGGYAAPTVGGSGSTGLYVSSYVTIYNYGYICGGGGGGGGGGGNGAAGGGGGGGGAPYAGAGPATSSDRWGASGSAAGINYGGTGGNGSAGAGGGAGGNSLGVYGSNSPISSGFYVGSGGGGGGGNGAPGGSGSYASSSKYGTLWGAGGGPAGYAVSGNGYITWAATGTRYGAIG